MIFSIKFITEWSKPIVIQNLWLNLVDFVLHNEMMKDQRWQYPKTTCAGTIWGTAVFSVVKYKISSTRTPEDEVLADTYCTE